jgi:hypothetical protein
MSETERPFFPMSGELGGDFMSGMADSIRERRAREVPEREGVTADEIETEVMAKMPDVRVLRLGNVRIYERQPWALLIRGTYPCPHRTQECESVEHLHYHVTRARKTEREYEEVVNWLECGFWTDACVRPTREAELRLVRAIFGESTPLPTNDAC